MYVRREGLPGVATPEGILTRLRGTPFDRIIGEIESVPERSAIGLGLMLLELSEETIETLNGYMKEVLERTVADGGLHDVSIYISGVSTGLTLHSSALRPPESARRLAQPLWCEEVPAKGRSMVRGGIAARWHVGLWGGVDWGVGKK